MDGVIDVDAFDLFIEYLKRENTFRNDLSHYSLFVRGRDSEGNADEKIPVDLFWETWFPHTSDSFFDAFYEPKPLPEDIESHFLEGLAEQERECRIPYVPDRDDLSDLAATDGQFQLGHQYVHVAAASALRHFKRDGFSDYVRQTLVEVNRVLYGLGITDSFWLDATDGSYIISQFGVQSLVHGALSSVKYLDGDYENALLLAVSAVVSFDAVTDVVDVDREFLSENFKEEHIVSVEILIRMLIQRNFKSVNLNSQHIVNAFEGLKMLGNSQNWRLVARGCSLLAGTTDWKLRESEVTDEDGKRENWYAYWYRAEGWASAQLGQNELRDYLRQQEMDASEKRLRGYFFGETWRNIPEKAREHMVNVDVLWFTEARGAATDAVLNDLQVAAETMCYDFIWEPLRKAEGDLELLEFKKRDAGLSENHRFPTLADYAWVCGQRFFKAFVQGLGLSEEEQRFLTADLESALDFLRRGRDSVQHDPNTRLRREDVERLVNLFFGIGQPGVLRRLAEIGTKLTGK